MFAKAIDFSGDHVVAKERESRLPPSMTLGPAFEFGAVAGPRSEKRQFALFIFVISNASDGLEANPLRLAIVGGSPVMVHPGLEMLDQLFRR
jgi:hypothetical protein